MRNISASSLEQLATQTGTEPYFIVGVMWDGVHEVLYADKAVENIPGMIQSVAGLDSVIRLDGNSSSGSVQVVFDDTAGRIKQIFDTHNIHYKKVKVYQAFAAIPSSEKILLFEGRITSQILWDESDRTFEINALSINGFMETGFAVEEGRFPKVHQSLLNKPWPQCFGTPVHVPTLALQVIPTGTIQKAFGLHDPTLEPQIAILTQKIGNYNAGIDLALKYQGFALFNGDPDLSDQWGAVATDLQNRRNEAQDEVNKLGLVLTNQRQWEYLDNHVIGGFQFPQNVSLTVKVGEQLFTARFKGGENLNGFQIQNNPDAACAVHLTPIYPPYPVVIADITQGGQPAINPLVKQGFQFFQAGSQITIIGDYTIDHVVSIVPGTVLSVYAYRAYNGLSKLTLVPNQYYTVISLPYGPTGTVGIRLKRPLSSISYFLNLQTTRSEDYLTQQSQQTGTPIKPHIVTNVDWSDDIYVTFESSVGPNAVDIITYLIARYTDHDVDATSFAYVHGKLTEFPANFAIFDRPTVDALVADIAFQTRCAVYVKNNTYFLKYLPEEVDPVGTITLDDVIDDSLRVTTTDTENIVTKYIVTWSPDYARPEPNEVVLRNNLFIYGLNIQTANYYIYNQYELVRKVASFWMIRNSNVWKRVECDLLLSKLAFETFDTVTLDIGSAVSSGPVPALIDSNVYDSETLKLSTVLWVPIRLGEMAQNKFAWPSNLTESDFYPVFFDETGGGAGGFNQGVAGHLPTWGNIEVIIVDDPPETAVSDDETPQDFGDTTPGDVGFTAPTPYLPRDQVYGFSVPPTFAYEYKDLAPPQVAVKRDPTYTYPAKVVSGSGKEYTMAVYKHGILGDSTNVPHVMQLQINESLTIQPNTWALVTEVLDSTGNPTYSMQVPIFLRKPT